MFTGSQPWYLTESKEGLSKYVSGRVDAEIPRALRSGACGPSLERPTDSMIQCQRIFVFLVQTSTSKRHDMINLAECQEFSPQLISSGQRNYPQNHGCQDLLWAVEGVPRPLGAL